MTKPKARTASTTQELAANTTARPAAKSRRVNAIDLPIPTIQQRSGNVLVCGQNDVGQLGMDPDEVVEKTRPALQSQVEDIVDIKTGGMHSLCLTKSGEIWSFGCNDEGALGRNTEDEEGSETKPRKVTALPGKVVKISAGDSHSACLLEDGRVFAWGSFRDSHGTMGLTKDGNKKSPVQVVKDIIAVDIASGSDHLVVLANNGHVLTLGCAEQGQLGRVSARTLTGESRRGTTTLLTPDYITKKAGNFVANAIWTTRFCTYLRENSSDQIYGFGLNNYLQLGIQKRGKEFEHFPVLSSFKNVKSISGGQHHTIVLTNDGKVHAIGRKDYGRLGLGEVEKDVEALTLISGLKQEIAQVSCGETNSFAITADGKVFVWGMGTSSTLGTGDEDDVTEPRLLASQQVKEKTILSVSSGGQHSLFLVEVPESTAKPVKAPAAKTVSSTSQDSEAAPKENGTKASKTKASKKPAETSVNMEVDSTTDVNGNSEKDEKMEVDTEKAKKSRQRKA